jgi:hypothetical protein
MEESYISITCINEVLVISCAATLPRVDVLRTDFPTSCGSSTENAQSISLRAVFVCAFVTHIDGNIEEEQYGWKMEKRVAG